MVSELFGKASVFAKVRITYTAVERPAQPQQEPQGNDVRPVRWAPGARHPGGSPRLQAKGTCSLETGTAGRPTIGRDALENCDDSERDMDVLRTTWGAY